MAVYSIELAVTFAEPLVGGFSSMTRDTESPSGSIPSRGIGIATVSPENTRPSTVSGDGGELFSRSISLMWKVTRAEACCPSGPDTVYTAETVLASSPARKRI